MKTIPNISISKASFFATVSATLLTLFAQPMFTGAMAQDGENLLLEEIVVTARRREESLMDLPMSIVAITAQAMQDQGIRTINQLGDLVPNVTLDIAERGSNTLVVIRGIGGGSPDPVQVFGSGMYIDGHYIPSSLGGFMSTVDIERVEVLRGPQGTLFGKNVTGGAINIVTAKPSQEFESSIRVGVAEDGQLDLRGMINGGLTENIAGRLSIAKEEFDGYYFNRNYGTSTGGTDMTAITGALRFTPGDNWTIDVSASYTDNDDGQTPTQCGTLGGPIEGRGFVTLMPLGEPYYDGVAQDVADACEADVAAGEFINSEDKQVFVDLKVKSAFATAQWDSDGEIGALDNLSVKVNGSWRETDYAYLHSRNTTFYDIFVAGTLGTIGQDDETKGFEFLVEGRANDNLDFTFGVNYFDELALQGDGGCRDQFFASPASEIDTAAGLTAGGNLIGVNPGLTFDCVDPSGLAFERVPGPLDNNTRFGSQLNNARVENTSLGIFGHLTYEINDQWTLDVGARWTEDDRTYWNLEVPATNCNTSVNQSQRSLGNAAATGDPGLCPGFTVPMSFVAVFEDGFTNNNSQKWSAITPMASLTYQIDDDKMMYVLYSEGFLTGGFNAEINSSIPGIGFLTTFDNESVKNYELGFKGTFADGRLSIMADIFYMDYTDKQAEVEVDNADLALGPQDPLRVFRNVAEVEIYGVEFELRAVPWDGGLFTLDYGYLKNEYGDYTYSDPDPAGAGGLIDETNTVIEDQTPDWTINISLQHDFALGNGATVTPRLALYAQDDYDYQSSTLDAAPSVCNQESYVKIDSRVTYEPAAANWQLTAYANNLTDEVIFESCRGSFLQGYQAYRYERPRYFGLEFNMAWGQ